MLSQLLQEREKENRPVRVGIIGTGKFGGGLVAQISRMRGMEVAAIADIRPENARYAYEVSYGEGVDIAVVDSVQALSRAVLAGQRAITQDGLLLAAADGIDVVVEATGLTEVGARMACAILENGKHLVMVNVETDVTIGALLRRKADSAGVVYSLVDGDQPGVTMNILEWAWTLGFEIVAAGRGTMLFKDDPAGTPDNVAVRFGFDEETLERRRINLKMYNSFRDGTKAQVEATAIANMAGLVPDVRGMHEASCNLADIPKACALREEGGLLSQHGVIELANSVAEDGETVLDNPLNMGVFVVIRTDHPFIMEDLGAYFLHGGGNGHNYLLYRPYHLVAVEAPITIAKAALYGQPTGAPRMVPTADVVTTAKRDLRAGEVLDGGGGYTVIGQSEKATVSRAEGLLPLGVCEGAVLKRDVAEGEAVAYDAVELKEDSFVLQLRREQDEWAVG
jgi:predicted homoserine dehydrogenase-like protein